MPILLCMLFLISVTCFCIHSLHVPFWSRWFQRGFRSFPKDTGSRYTSICRLVTGGRWRWVLNCCFTQSVSRTAVGRRTVSSLVLSDCSSTYLLSGDSPAKSPSPFHHVYTVLSRSDHPHLPSIRSYVLSWHFHLTDLIFPKIIITQRFKKVFKRFS